MKEKEKSSVPRRLHVAVGYLSFHFHSFYFLELPNDIILLRRFSQLSFAAFYCKTFIMQIYTGLKQGTLLFCVGN